jgi:hypothetical protein
MVNDSPPDSWYEDPATGFPCPDCYRELGMALFYPFSIDPNIEFCDEEVKTCKRHKLQHLADREWDD